MASGKLPLPLWAATVEGFVVLSAALTDGCWEDCVAAPWWQQDSRYRWLSLFLIHWERTGRGILSVNTSTINSLNVPRANLGTWQIYFFNGKMYSMPPVPWLHCEIKTDVGCNFRTKSTWKLRNFFFHHQIEHLIDDLHFSGLGNWSLASVGSFSPSAARTLSLSWPSCHSVLLSPGPGHSAYGIPPVRHVAQRAQLGKQQGFRVYCVD